MEDGFVVCVGDDEIGFCDDFHTDEDVIFVNIGTIDIYISQQQSIRQTDMHVVHASLRAYSVFYIAEETICY